MKKFKISKKNKDWLKLCLEMFIEITTYSLIPLIYDTIKETLKVNNDIAYKILIIIFIAMVFSEKLTTIFFKQYKKEEEEKK